MPFNITTKAVDKLLAVISNQGMPPNTMISISPEGAMGTSCGGSVGYRIGFTFGYDPETQIMKQYRNGDLKIVLNKKDLIMLDNLCITYHVDSTKEGLVFKST